MTFSSHDVRGRLRLAAAAALLLVACNGTVGVPSTSTGSGGQSAASTTGGSGAGGGAAVCDLAGSPGACAACCEQQNPAAKEHFDAAIGDCVCNSCSPSCKQSVCSDLQTPSDQCLGCVQEALAGDTCQNHAGLFESACLWEPVCEAYVQCLLSCPG